MADKKIRMRFSGSATAAVACAVCVVALIAWYAFCYPSHFLLQEQNQIFLNEKGFLLQYFRWPAWLSVMAGEWLTQFYIYPVVGPAILTLAIALCVGLFGMVVKRLLPKVFAWVLTLGFALLMIGCSFASSTSLSFFLSIAGGLGLGIIGAESLKGGVDIAFSFPLLVILSFWAFGFGGLATGLVICLVALKVGLLKNRSRCIAAAVGLAIAVVGLWCFCKAYPLSCRQTLLYPGMAKLSLPEMKYEYRLRIADAFYEKDLAEVKDLAMKADDPDEFTSFYYYLASAIQDSLPDNLLKYPVKSLGTLTTIGETTPLPIINMMNDLYYELGDMTYAERAAMMRNVFSPRNRNVRMIRRLAEINLVSGDTLAALKYLAVLGRTHAYADWSRDYQPGRMTPQAAKDILGRRDFTNSKDNIRLGDNCRHIILELLESNPQNTKALDYLLCTDLLLKDIDTFKMDYDTYCMEKGNPRYKDLYQQALMIYLAGTEAPAEEWDKYIVPGRQMQLFNQYSNRRGDPAFAGTYWYYFDRQK